LGSKLKRADYSTGTADDNENIDREILW
jgi:hypothetical protein